MDINICTACDDNYAEYASVMFASVLKNSSAHLHLYILDGGISDDKKRNFCSLKKIRDFKLDFIKIDEAELSDCSVHFNHITMPTYYRFLLPDLISVDKVIYLDSDVIVKTDIGKIFSEDLSDYLVAGIEDAGYVRARKHDVRYDIDGDYINAGVLLINLKKWRDENIKSKLLEYAKNRKDDFIMFQDQDILNAVLNKNIKLLSDNLNVQSSFFDIDIKKNENKKIKQALENPLIIHYSSPQKPWNNFREVKRSEEFFKYVALTDYRRKYPSYLFVKTVLFFDGIKKYILR